jgi:hypothetical protein
MIRVQGYVQDYDVVRLRVTYLRRNVTIVCGASYHLLGSQISQDSKIRFRIQVESYIRDWRFSNSQHLASYVSCHNAMVYDKGTDASLRMAKTPLQ